MDGDVAAAADVEEDVDKGVDEAIDVDVADGFLAKELPQKSTCWRLPPLPSSVFFFLLPIFGERKPA